MLEPIRQTWSDICTGYDFVAPMPELSTLFAQTSLDRPFQAAEQAIVNMLVEATESVDRFSPWYSKPAGAFGLGTVRDDATQHVGWRLTEEGCRHWWQHIERMANAISANASVLEASLFVDGLMLSEPDSLVKARCRCKPPRYIRVRRIVVKKSEVVCDLCSQPFILANNIS